VVEKKHFLSTGSVHLNRHGKPQGKPNVPDAVWSLLRVRKSINGAANAVGIFALPMLLLAKLFSKGIKAVNRCLSLRAVIIGSTCLILAGCGERSSLPSVSAPSPALMRSAPVPPYGALPGLSLPEGDGNGGFRTPNSGIGPAEAVWHVRSALNVAALACDDRGIVASYNMLLKRQKTALAAAHKAELRQSGSASAMDVHMTRLYNFFAQPPVQRRFCSAASGVAAEAGTARDLQQFSASAIGRLDQPFQDFYRSYQDYQRDLAAWKANGGRFAPPPAQARPAAVMKQSLGGEVWRVQLGAFSSPAAARTAWREVGRRAPGLASFTPHYEDAAKKGLVRLQIGPAGNRSEALKLCAAAAVAGLDCLPVSPDR